MLTPIRRAIALTLALAAPAAMADEVWRSDFEAGDLTEWTKLQAVSPDRAAIVPAPGGRSGNALKFTVNKGDDPINSGNDRAELVKMTMEPEGSEYFYRWSVMFDEGYPSHPKWQLFTQWHQEQLAGTPPLEMYVAGEEMRLRAGGHDAKDQWTAPLARGTWHDFILRVKWSADPSVGFIELYHNGELALPKTHGATQLPGQKNYLKMGLYRSKEISQKGVLYIDDVVMGTSMESVMPQPPAEEPAAGEAVAESGATNTDVPGGTFLDGSGGSGAAYEYGEEVTPEQVASCGASSTGGFAPLAAAVMLIGGLGLVRRRKPAEAKVAVRK